MVLKCLLRTYCTTRRYRLFQRTLISLHACEIDTTSLCTVYRVTEGHTSSKYKNFARYCNDGRTGTADLCTTGHIVESLNQNRRLWQFSTQSHIRKIWPQIAANPQVITMKENATDLIATYWRYRNKYNYLFDFKRFIFARFRTSYIISFQTIWVCSKFQIPQHFV